MNMLFRSAQRSSLLAGTLFFCLLSVTAALPQSAEDRTVTPIVAHKQLALVIGNAGYANGPLVNSVNDAQSMAGRLRQLGFDVSLVTNADRESMDKAVDQFAAKLGAGDVAFFYYSGHGMQVDGENYLIPIDFHGQTEADARYRANPAGLILDRMEKSGAQLNIMVLDACRNNPYHSATRSGSGGLAKMPASRGTFIAFATAPGHIASDNPNGRNGLFTQFLLEALAAPGLSLNDVFDLVREKVDSASGGKQLPWTESSVVGRFSFVPSPAASPVAAPIAGDAFATAKRLWDAKDYPQALPLFRRAAEASKTEAYFYLGDMYEGGKGGLPKDLSQAVAWYRRGADLGDPHCKGSLGSMYHNGWGGLTEDDAYASKLWREAANAGDPRGMNGVGYMYENGLGGVSKDETQAVAWYQKAAEAGSGDGMANLGVMYENGLGGVSKDETQAVVWYRNAAEAGDGLGMTYLGAYYANGLGGLLKDETQAVAWYRKAASAGSATGMLNLANMYEIGHGGLPKDHAQAMIWFRNAADAGSEDANEYLKKHKR